MRGTIGDACSIAAPRARKPYFPIKALSSLWSELNSGRPRIGRPEEAAVGDRLCGLRLSWFCRHYKARAERRDYLRHDCN